MHKLRTLTLTRDNDYGTWAFFSACMSMPVCQGTVRVRIFIYFFPAGLCGYTRGETSQVLLGDAKGCTGTNMSLCEIWPLGDSC